MLIATAKAAFGNRWWLAVDTETGKLSNGPPPRHARNNWPASNMDGSPPESPLPKRATEDRDDEAVA